MNALTTGLVTSADTDYIVIQRLSPMNVAVYLKDKQTDKVRAATVSPVHPADALDLIPYGYEVEFH